jgi:putative transposase
MQKQHLKLAEADRQELMGLLQNRSLTVKIHQRIKVLLGLDSGKSYNELGKELGFTHISMRNIRDKYVNKAKDSTAISYLCDKARSGRPINISGEERAKITALACSESPDGRVRWTLRLLADKVVELGICEHISHTQAGNILKKMSLSRI